MLLGAVLLVGAGLAPRVDAHDAPATTAASSATVSVTARGTAARRIVPRMAVYHNGVRRGTVSVGPRTTIYTFPLATGLSRGDRLDVRFFNDGGTKRSLTVWNVSSGGAAIASTGRGVVFDRGTTYAKATDGKNASRGRRLMNVNGALRFVWSTLPASPPTPPAPPTPTPPTNPSINTAAIPPGSPGFGRDMLIPATDVPKSSGVYEAGAFRTVCDYTHMSFDDPIVYPNQPGRAHLHAFFGNAGANAYSTTPSLLTTGNGSCRGGTINRSGYWAPAVIDTRSGTPIRPKSLIVYYKSVYRGVDGTQAQMMPEGLRMIAGSKQGDTTPPESVVYGCLADTVYTPYRSIPVCPAGTELQMSLRFPQCWDGRNIDSADHRSHMAYAEYPTGCPVTHPVPLPEVTYNVRYLLRASDDTRAWRLSSDHESNLPSGYSFHADWWNGWKPDIMQTWLTHCIRAKVDCSAHLLGDGRQMEGTYDEGAR